MLPGRALPLSQASGDCGWRGASFFAAFALAEAYFHFAIAAS